MNSSADSIPVRDHDWLRPLRYLWRTPLLLLHALIAFPLALAAFNPLARRLVIRGERFDYAMTRWWSGRIVRIFGFRIRQIGQPLPGAVLFVANHVSWLDIELMHSKRIMSFVAKAEIARWPLIGPLSSMAGTIYHQRGSGHSLNSVMQRVVARLGEGMAVGVFPEGGTGPGRSLAHISCTHFPGCARRECTGATSRTCYTDATAHGLTCAVRRERELLRQFHPLARQPRHGRAKCIFWIRWRNITMAVGRLRQMHARELARHSGFARRMTRIE